MSDLSNSVATVALREVKAALSNGDSEPTLMEFERQLFHWLMALGCNVFQMMMQELDTYLILQLDSRKLRIKATHSRRLITRFGPVDVPRTMVQAVRNGSVFSVLDRHLQLVHGFVTPLAAKLSVRACAHMTTRAAAAWFSELGGFSPSRSTIHRLVQTFGHAVDRQRAVLHGLVCERSKPPKDAVTVAVMLDGVMAHMVGGRRKQLEEEARAEGRKIGGPVGYRECSVGAIVYYDDQGTRLDTIRFARMPESNKSSLKTELSQVMAHVVAIRPDLTVVAVSDGAPNIWSFLTNLDCDYELVDYYHAAEHIQRRLNKSLGVGTRRNQRLSRELRRQLKRPNGHQRVFEAIVQLEKRCGSFKPRKTKGRGSQPDFYERHSHRMDYAGAAGRCVPIGSGVIEGTARHIVVDRLRQTGMRWKQAGGQAILDLRCTVINGIFTTCWDAVMPAPVLAVN